jgi:hypothetical protein
VTLALTVTLHVKLLVVVHPVQEEKLLPPAVAGAVSVTAAPDLYVRVKADDPLVAPLLSAGVTVMATPLLGVAESTVSTKLDGGGGVLVPPPQAVSARLSPVAIKVAAFQPWLFIQYLPIWPTMRFVLWSAGLKPSRAL